MKKRRSFSYLILFLCTNLIFALLYRRFLLGDGVYMYLDSGSDSMSSSYPIIVLLGRLFRSGDFSSYNLTFGLGNDITSTFLQYLNPVKFLLLFFNENTLPVGIMVMVFIVTNLTSLFAWLYFRLLLKRDDAAFFPALMWTFSGYIVLWSQNLSFGCAMMMVTATMLLLEHFLETPKKTWWLALSGEAALFLVTNYYFLYITVVFAALYMILRGILTKTGLKEFFRTFALAVLSVIASFCLSMVAIIPIIQNFSGSSRTGNVSSGSSLRLSLGDHLDAKRALTILGRLFSPNTWGIADSYSGSVNYYEAALISTSILALFAVIYLLLKKASRLKTFLILAVCVIMLAVPFTGQIMNLNVLSYRYTFVISFTECIAAGFFMKSLLEDPDCKVLCVTSVLTLLFTAAALFVSRISGRSVGLAEESRTAKLVIFTAGAWFLFFMLCAIPLHQKFSHGKKLHSVFLALSLLLLSGELILMNNDSLYLRSYVTKDMFQNSMYHNGVKDAIREVRDKDSSLFRSVADSSFNFANQGAVDSYSSTTGYFNTTPASLQSYSLNNGMFQFSSSYFLSDVQQYPEFTLLSGKYLLKDRSNPLDMMVEPSLFETASASSDTKRVVFENKNALPFGYLYKNQMRFSDYESLSLPEKMYAQTQSYYETTGDNQTDSSSSAPAKDTSVSVTNLLPSADETSNLSVKTAPDSASDDTITTMAPSGEDPWVIYHFDTSADTENTVHFLYLKLKDLPTDGSKLAIPVYYLSEDHPVADKVFSNIYYISADYPELCIMLPDGTNGIRLGVPADEMQVTFRNVQILTTDSLSSAFTTLKDDSKAVSHISYNERTDTYRAEVDADQDSMLCVPLFITKNWSATVNGTPVRIHNINGGLIGIPVRQGANHIVLRYAVPHLKAGAAISIVSLIVYVIAWGYVLLGRQGKYKKSR